MKVKDLIEKLQRVDPEMEVFASPCIYIEDGGIVNSGIPQPKKEHKSYKRMADPSKRHPIESVMQLRSMREDPDINYLILAFDDSWSNQIEE